MRRSYGTIGPGLYPLLPDKVEVDRDGKGELYYVYKKEYKTGTIKWKNKDKKIVKYKQKYLKIIVKYIQCLIY